VPTISIYVSNEVNAWLISKANARGTTATKLATMILREWYEKQRSDMNADG